MLHNVSANAPQPLETTLFICNQPSSSYGETIKGVLSALKPSPYSVDISTASQSVTVRHDSGLSPTIIKSAVEGAGLDIVSATFACGSPTLDVSVTGADLSLETPETRGMRTAQCPLYQAETQTAGRVEGIPTPATPSETCTHLPASQEEHGPYSIHISIGGMTCAACSSTVTRLVSELDGVLDVVVDLMGHSAKIVVEEMKISQIVAETIEDAGFSAEVVNTRPIFHSAQSDTSGLRTVSIKVEGMSCPQCPIKVMKAVAGLQDNLTVLKPLTSYTDAILTLSYIPISPLFTIRSIVSAISSQSPNFKVSVYHPPTLEDRARDMQATERRRLLHRLIFSALVAIPTFIIGIVYMTLVPNNDPKKQYLMSPMWFGTVSRAEWALFFLATPVMFYSAGSFHRKSFKELRALWRKGSKTPIWKRFVRFGSMNLLVSTGVSIAYFASIALLALSASQKHDPNNNGFTTTYFDSVVFLTMFLLTGRYLEAYSKGHAANAVNSLGKLRPPQALLASPDSLTPKFNLSTTSSTVDLEIGNPEMDSLPYMPGNATETTDATLLEVGDIVRVPSGSSPPADGTIVLGETLFDESSLTGESKHVRKYVGDQVFLGTINKGKVVDVRVDGVGGQSMLDQIVEVVREGQTRRAPIERVADSITAYFVPVVTLIAIITWIIWLGLGLGGILPKRYLDIQVGGWTVWSLRFSIAVFVVACPCGIALAAPTALLVGSGLAAKFGILVCGGGEAFQECAQLDVIVFDKTGTLTEGCQPQVTDIEFVETRQTREALLGLAYTIVSGSSHPVAQAIRSYGDMKFIKSSPVNNVEEIPGRGLKATAGDTSADASAVDILIGNISFLEEHEALVGDHLARCIGAWRHQGKSVSVMAIRDDVSFTPVVAFAVADRLRPEAKAVVARLQELGLSTWILSGDHHTTAKAVARSVGIPEGNVIAGVLPHEKAQKVQCLQQSGLKRPISGWRNIFGQVRLNKRSVVAMIGDGINDAPALTAADVGIAVGSGSDVAISNASFTLLSSNLTAILTLMDLSRTVFNRVIMNFFWAGIYNIVAVPIAAGVIYPIGNVRLDPVWASLAMALSSVSVVCSSLMLKFYKEPRI